MKTTLLLIGLLFLGGCGNQEAQQPVVGDDEPDTIIVQRPVAVPVPPPDPVLPLTNMDILRDFCWYMEDWAIYEGVGIVNSHWWGGWTYAVQLQRNLDVCGLDVDCLDCWDAISLYVYEDYH